MPFIRKRLVTGISVLYLLALTGLAAYALHSANTYNLPIPNIICALTIALPPLAGVALETVLSLNDSLARKGQLQASRVVQVVVAFFLIAESVLATLSAAHLSSRFDCVLKAKWLMMWVQKDGTAIRRIQDAFSCCGFESTKDMAWPLPDARHDVDACEVLYDRNASCKEPWTGEERKVAIMLLIVPLAVFLWKVAILFFATRKSGWLPSHIRLPEDGSQSSVASGPRKPRAAIAYRDLESEDGQVRDDSLQRVVTGLNEDSQLATQVESNRTRTSSLLDESNQWRS